MFENKRKLEIEIKGNEMRKGECREMSSTGRSGSARGLES